MVLKGSAVAPITGGLEGEGVEGEGDASSLFFSSSLSLLVYNMFSLSQSFSRFAFFSRDKHGGC